MKLASYKDGSRDGQLVVVSRDLASAHYASGIAGRLQQVLDDWNFLSPQLQHVYDTLNQGKLRHSFPFDPSRCMAPLPRPVQWIVASAGAPAADVEDAEDTPGANLTPVIEAVADDLLGPQDDLAPAEAAAGIAIEALVAAITDDVPAGASADTGLDAVRLLLLASEATLHDPAAQPAIHGANPADASGRHRRASFDRRLATAFAAVAVTPDELGPAWRGGRIDASMQVSVNGRPVERLEVRRSMPAGFGEIVAAAVARRPLRAGCIVGCRLGRAGGTTAQAAAGDQVRIELERAEAPSVFGPIDHRIAGG